MNFSNETFDKFFAKFNNLSSEIEGLQRTYPQIVSSQIIEKLNQLKRDTGVLTQELRRMDSRVSEKTIELENMCQVLNNQIVKLKEEVENLVAINSELHSRLGDDDASKSFLDITPKSYTDKINYSQYQVSEDKVSNLRSELKDVKERLEKEKAEKKNYFAQVEWLRTNLEDSIKKYNEVLQEKLKLEDTLAEQLIDGDLGTDLRDQLQTYREKEVKIINQEILSWSNQRSRRRH